MGQIRFLRSARTIVILAAVALTLGSVAWGYDDYNRDQAQNRGFHNGFQDGVRAGHYDRERGYRFHFKNDQWNYGRDGYEHWMGSSGHYKKAYRHGYEDGYRRSFNGSRRDWDRDGYRDWNGYRGDDRWRDHRDWR